MIDDFWDWTDDRTVQERGAAREILQSAKFEVTKFASREDDPPDCEGRINGQWCAIEVTRLTHEKTRALNIKAIKEQKPGVYFQWGRDDLLRKLQEQIGRKDEAVKRYNSGPYDRYILVMHTDEFILDSPTIEKFLDGATFRTRHLTDVVFGLSYHPGFGYPTFRLRLEL